MLNCEDAKIFNFIEKYNENNIYNLNTKFDPGLIIFENIDRFIHSYYSANLFNKLISSQLEDKQILFHFSNPTSKYISLIKQETNSLVIPMLKNNLKLKKASISYFGQKKCIEEWNILNKYNLDKNSLYGEGLQLKIAEQYLEEGNKDNYLQTSMKISDKINVNDLINKDIFYIFKKLMAELPNLVINPSKYKIIFSNDQCKWQYYTIPQLIELFKVIVQEKIWKTKVF